MKEVLKEYFSVRKKLKIAKNRYKAFCKISKICRKNKLELTRTSDYVLIIKGFFRGGIKVIIVSQDRNKIVNFDLIEVVEILPPFNKKICDKYTIKADSCFLGEYGTEERAKEVLKEILKKYDSAMRTLGKSCISFDYDFAYEMPDE